MSLEQSENRAKALQGSPGSYYSTEKAVTPSSIFLSPSCQGKTENLNTADAPKTHTFANIERRNSAQTLPSFSLTFPHSLPTNAADTTDLSTTSVAPQFHLRATGTHIFSKQLTQSEPKWQLPALKWLPCRIDAESQQRPA